MITYLTITPYKWGGEITVSFWFFPALLASIWALFSFKKNVFKTICSHTHTHTHTHTAGCDTRSIFKWHLKSLNTEFSFSEIICYAKVKEPSLSYFLPIDGRRIIGFIPFAMVLVLCEIQTALSKIDLKLLCPCLMTVMIIRQVVCIYHHHHQVVPPDSVEDRQSRIARQTINEVSRRKSTAKAKLKAASQQERVKMCIYIYI